MSRRIRTTGNKPLFFFFAIAPIVANQKFCDKCDIIDFVMNYANSTIYSIYVRNHTPEGTFKAVEADLDRIKALGTDIIWFLPIHPIGQKGKKGSLGCPYSISDYRAVNPEYGTLEDFRHLVDEIHKRGMKCIIDVVYNHTSQDSVLLAQHPEYFWKKENGSFGNRFGDWTDVYDLDYRNKDLWQYQIETLKYWATIVDGFRCDVASSVPVDFWVRARKAVAEVNPSCFWLAETVYREMVLEARKLGLDIWTDAELYSAFDAEYQYDIFFRFIDYFDGKGTLEAYLDALNSQENIYPLGYMKMRYVENHDQKRFADACPDEEKRRQWLEFMFFQKGPMLIYAGQEFSCTHTPSLFDIDKVDRSGKDISALIAEYAETKESLPENTFFEAKIVEKNIVKATHTVKGRIIAEKEFRL